MSENPWDSDDMNPQQNYNDGLNPYQNYNDGLNPYQNHNDGSNASYNYGQQFYHLKWNQNEMHNPQEYHNHMTAQSLDSFNQASVTNLNEPSDVAFALSGYNVSNYSPRCTNNSLHWSGQNQFASQNHFNPQLHSQYDNYQPYPHYVSLPQQNIEVNQHQQHEMLNDQELVNKSEDEAKYENIPLNEEATKSLAKQSSSDETQSAEISSHSPDQQVLPQASEPPIASLSTELPQLGLDVGPPPIGTMTGIPTRNQFRKTPLKKYYQDKINGNLSNYHGSLEMFQSDQKGIISPGSGDRIDFVADSGSLAIEESLDQKLADNEVALYNQACPSPASNHDSVNQPSEQSIQSEEVLTQMVKTLSVLEIDSKNGTDQMKPAPDDANPAESQTHSLNLFNPLQYLSRKKPHRDSTLSPATTLWDNFDVSPLKLGPKLVPAQEMEPSQDDGRQKAVTSPIQNTGTGPSNNNLTSVSELSSLALSSDPATLDLSFNSKEVLQLASFKVDNLTSVKESPVVDQLGTYEISLNQVTDAQVSSIQLKPSLQTSQSHEQQDVQTHALKQHTISQPQPQNIHQQQPSPLLQHLPLVSHQPTLVLQQPQQYLVPQQQQIIPPPQNLESDRQKKSIPMVASKISDPHLSAFSAVKTQGNGSGKNQDVSGKGYDTTSSFNAPTNRKTTYSALNPEPNPRNNELKQNDDMTRKQEIIPNESQQHQEVRAPSRQISDVSKYKEHPSYPQDYADVPRRRYDVDPSPRQGYGHDGSRKEYDDSILRPDSRAEYYEDPRRQYDERINPPSRQGYRSERQFHDRSNRNYDDFNQSNQRPESRSHYEDSQRRYEGRQEVDLPSRHALEDQYQGRNFRREHDEHSQRGFRSDSRLQYGDDYQRQYDERSQDQSSRRTLPEAQFQARPQYSRSSSPSQEFHGDKRQGPVRNSYDRPLSRQSERDPYRYDMRYHGNDRNTYQRDRYALDRNYSDAQYNADGHPQGGRYREREDPFTRSHSRQGQHVEDPYGSRDRYNYRGPEPYNRPRSRQEELVEFEKQMWNDYYKSYYDYYQKYYSSTYMNPYSQGFMDETKMNIRSTQLPFDTSMTEMEAAGFSRSSSRNFDSADQFARDSHGGSRSLSRMSGYFPQEGNVPYVEERKRLTPFKYSRCHIRASFSSLGQLVQIMPNNPTDGQPAIVRILSLCDEESDEVVELSNYPGPLGRGIHKNDVQDFCKQMSLKCKDNITLNDRSSAQLIWDFLALLIKQNGSIIGTDIAELLIQGRDLSYYDDNLSMEGETDDFNSSLKMGFDRSIVSASHQPEESMTADQITNQFRHLLLYGRKKDALDWAMKRNLWGHALYLASQMDAKTHAAVKTKFTNVSIRANDPLQTLYQILSGRQPSSVTLLDEKWGDWRPHLSMIVSNPSSKSELDKRSIVTLGDNLASHGLLHASHFCYLVSQTIFGGHNTKNSKLILIGSKQGLPMMEFATNASLWATEIYEYAISLASPSFYLTSLVIYKFVYMMRLVDLGLFEEALRYAEVIAQAIIGDKETSADSDLKSQDVIKSLSPGIVRFIANLSGSLKMWDPHRDSAGMDGDVDEDPVWCGKLFNIAGMIEDGTIRFRSLSPQPSSTEANSEIGEHLAMGIQQNASSADLSFSQRDWHDYLQGREGQGMETYDRTNTSQDDNWTNQPQFWGNQQLVEQSSTADPQHIYSPQGYSESFIPKYGDVPQAQQQQQPEVTFFQHQQTYPAFTIGTSDTDKIPEEPRHRVEHSYHHHHQQHHHHHQQNLPKGSRSRTTSSGSNTSRKSSVIAPSSPGKNNPFQFGVQPIMSNNDLMSGMNQALGAHNPTEQPKKKQPFPNDDTDDFDTKGQEASNKKAGWGFLNWFGGKKSKEVELPDDSKDSPAIVWDAAKNRWVNKDGDGYEDQELAPPPMIQNPAAPQLGGMNKFSISARPRGTRGPYTDVLQGSTNPALTASTSLLSTLPKSASNPANIFNPTFLPQDDNNSAQQQDAQDQSRQQHSPSQHHYQHLNQSPNNNQQPANSNKYFNPSEPRTIPQPGYKISPLKKEEDKL